MNPTLFYKRYKSRSSIHIFSMLLIYFLAVSSIFSPLRLMPYYNQLIAGSVLGWFALTLLGSPGYFFRPTLHSFAIYVFIIYTVLFAYLTNNDTIGNRFFELAQIPLFYLAYEKNRYYGQSRDNLLIVALFVPFIFITSFLTLYAYRINPYISRATKKQFSTGVENMKMGIGGYEFVYFLVFLLAVGVFFLLCKHQRFNRKQTIVGLIGLMVLIVNITLSNYSLAFLMLMLIVFMRLFFLQIRINTLVIYFIPITVFFILSAQITVFLLNMLINILGDTLNASRIIELKYLLISNSVGNAMESRFNVYAYSINAFLHNPVFGALAAPPGDYYSNVARYGNHSQLLDTFAFYGLGIGFLQLYVYLKPIKARIVKINGFYEGLPLLIMMLFVILITLNNVTPSIGFAVFFIYPTIYDWIKDNNSLPKKYDIEIKTRKYV